MAGLVGEREKSSLGCQKRGNNLLLPHLLPPSTLLVCTPNWRQGWDPSCSLELPGDPQLLEISTGQWCLAGEGSVWCSALWFRLACWASIASLGLPMALAGSPFQVAVPCDTVHDGAVVA